MSDFINIKDLLNKTDNIAAREEIEASGVPAEEYLTAKDFRDKIVTPIIQLQEAFVDISALSKDRDSFAQTGNTNSTSIEEKVNALIDCMNSLIDSVVFHKNTPFVSPTELKNKLNLQRYSVTTSTEDTKAICGVAVCGKTVCGVA